MSQSKQSTYLNLFECVPWTISGVVGSWSWSKDQIDLLRWFGVCICVGLIPWFWTIQVADFVKFQLIVVVSSTYTVLFLCSTSIRTNLSRNTGYVPHIVLYCRVPYLPCLSGLRRGFFLSWIYFVSRQLVIESIAWSKTHFNIRVFCANSTTYTTPSSLYTLHTKPSEEGKKTPAIS